MDGSTTNAPKTGKKMDKKTLYIIVGVIIVVIAGVLIYSLVSGNSKSASLAAYDNQPVPSSVISLLNIPNNTANAVGIGIASESTVNINGSTIDVGGKPYILYMGSEYCPFCAAERWSMIIALMRFGTFSGLDYMTSSASDSFPNTPTFTFAHATYSSQYITFVPVELTTNIHINGSSEYQQLEVPNSSENKTIQAYDPTGSIPFIFFANKTAWSGSSYTPSLLDSGNWSVIAGELQNSSTAQAQGVVGAANLMTAQICEIDNNKPASVCTQQYVTNIEGQG